MKGHIVISANETERIQALRASFRAQLEAWFAGIAAGVRYTPDVARVLSESLLEMGVVAWIAGQDQLGPDTPDSDEADAARSAEVFKKLVALLETETAH